METKVCAPTSQPQPMLQRAWGCMFVTGLSTLFLLPFLMFASWRKALLGRVSIMRLIWYGADPWCAWMLLIFGPFIFERKKKLAAYPTSLEQPSLVRYKDALASTVLGEPFTFALERGGMRNGLLAFLLHGVLGRLALPQPCTWRPKWSRERFRHTLRAEFSRSGIVPRLQLDDLDSEANIVHYCTSGYAANFLAKDADGPSFVVDMSHIEKLNGGDMVRPGFHRYGGKLYISSDLKRVEKLVLLGREYRLGEEDFPGAMFVFRSTVQITSVMGPHTVHCHLYDSGLAHVALAEIEATHPFRRMLSPFLVGSSLVNWGAIHIILPTDGILMRTSGFNAPAFNEVYQHYGREWRHQCVPEELSAKGLLEHAASPEGFGYGYWGLRLHTIFETFVKQYMSLYWETDEQIANDQGIQAFFRDYDDLIPKMAKHRLPVPTTRQEVVNWVCYLMHTVTVLHEQTGWVIDMINAYDFNHIFAIDRPLKDKRELMPDCCARIFMAFGMALTSKPAAPLIQRDRASREAFTRFYDREVFDVAISDQFFDNLAALSDEMVQYNRSRTTAEGPSTSAAMLDPAYLELAVTV